MHASGILLTGMPRVLDTINAILDQPGWPLSQCIKAKHTSRKTCAQAKVILFSGSLLWFSGADD